MEYAPLMARDLPGTQRRSFLIGLFVGMFGLFAVGVVTHASYIMPTLMLHANPSPSLSTLSGLSEAELALINAPKDPSSTLSQEEWISARIARWIVHANNWATVATLSKHLNGAPFANMKAYSDGATAAASNSTGHLYFYETTMDPTGDDLAVHEQASVSITMAQLNRCAMDPQDPTCWKVIFSGAIRLVNGENNDAALAALFFKHPQMKLWPNNHGFKAYEMHPTEILLLDYYGGAKKIDPQVYYSIKFDA